MCKSSCGDLVAYNRAQMERMLSPDNLWFTGEVVGHSPSREEAAMHYINSGAAAEFRNEWEREHGQN